MQRRRHREKKPRLRRLRKPGRDGPGPTVICRKLPWYRDPLDRRSNGPSRWMSRGSPRQYHSMILPPTTNRRPCHLSQTLINQCRGAVSLMTWALRRATRANRLSQHDHRCVISSMRPHTLPKSNGARGRLWTPMADHARRVACHEVKINDSSLLYPRVSDRHPRGREMRVRM